MMNWLVLSWALTFGYVPANFDSINNLNGTFDRAVVSNNGGYAVTVDLSAEIFNHLLIQGAVETYINAVSFPYFAPYRADYTMKIALYDKHFEVGFMHECDHSVLSSANRLVPWYGNYETQLYVKIKGKTTF